MKCEEDKNRFQKGVEKDLIALSEESIPVNTRQKAMWSYRLYEKWVQWWKDAYDPRVDLSTVGDLLMIHTELAGVPDPSNSFASLSQKLGKMEENVIQQKHYLSWSVICRNILK